MAPTRKEPADLIARGYYFHANGSNQHDDGFWLKIDGMKIAQQQRRNVCVKLFPERSFAVCRNKSKAENRHKNAENNRIIRDEVLFSSPTFTGPWPSNGSPESY